MSEENNPTETDDRVDPVEGKHNVEVTKTPIVDLSDKRPDSPEAVQQEYASFPETDALELDRRAENYPNLQEVDQTWYSAYSQGLSHIPKGGMLQNSVDRDTGYWRQYVNTDGQEIGVGKPRVGSGGSIAGEQALMRATDLLGSGNTISVPLWHTGIWVTVKPPTEGDLLSLEQQLGDDKIELGRYTRGMLFSNTQVYTVYRLLNFVFRFVHDSTLKNSNNETLRRVIKSPDIQLLFWALARAVYPSGYKYARACTNDPSKCEHVETGTVDFGKMFFTDNAALTDWQKRFMSDRNAKRSLEEVKTYQAEHERGQPYTVDLASQFKVRFAVPTIEQYQSAGFAWVDGIAEAVEEQLTTETDTRERNRNMLNQAKASKLRQYAHWVDQIIMGDEDDQSVVDDRDTIDRLLGTMSGVDAVYDKFNEKIAKYIDDSMISLIAIPKYNCRMCNAEQKGDIYQNQFPELLAIDVVSAFFTLLDQRVFRMLTTRDV